MSKTDRTLSINGVRVPRLLYGTAWKEDETERLTALRCGKASGALIRLTSVAITTRRELAGPSQRRSRTAS